LPLAVGPVDLDDHQALTAQRAGQPGAEAAGALDPEAVQHAEL
jgi:hypothetical protein